MGFSWRWKDEKWYKKHVIDLEEEENFESLKKELQDFKSKLDKEKNVEKVNVIYN